MEHVYDFYKPNLGSEYPVVDGRLSIQCYLNALDQCYKTYGERVARQNGAKQFTVDQGDFYIFHSPFTRLVQKSFARLVLQDYLSEGEKDSSKYAGLETVK